MEYLTTEAMVSASSFSMTLQLIKQQQRTLRSLIRLLSAFIADVPFVGGDEGKDEDKE